MGQAVATLAGRQWGVVARAQLRGVGAGDDQVDRWIAARRLVPLHRGVFAVGHRLLTVEGRWMAGVLAGGARAVLSHRSAGDHWGLTGLARPTAHVTVATNRRPRVGVVFHTRGLPVDEVTEHEGIPITTVARTLFDIAASESRARLRQAIAIVESRVMGDETSLADLLARYPGHRGVAVVRSELIALREERGIANRELELRFAEFIDRCGLPRPERNARVAVAGGSFIVDCLWRSAGLVVELDSRLHHGDWEAAENDRARDAALLAVGLRTIRVTWRRLHDEPSILEAQLGAALEIHLHRS